MPACQAIENDVTSTLGHGGLGLATGACDNLCPTRKPWSFQLGKRPRHPHPHPISQQGSLMQLNVLIHKRVFDYALISALCFNTSMLNINPSLFFSNHAVQRLHSCHLPPVFVVVLRGGKEQGRARRRPSGAWCMASGEETQHRRWENVEMYAWHGACCAQPTLHCV